MEVITDAPCLAWWCMSIVPTLGSYKFKASLGYIEKPCPKQTNKQAEIHPNGSRAPSASCVLHTFI